MKEQTGDFFYARHGEESQDNILNKIPFRIKDKIYRIMIQSRFLNQPVSLERMSSGTKRIIWLLANIFIASCTGVNCIGVEELETSIHPQLIKQLLDVISQGLKDTRLIISSHSPYTVQYINLSQIYVGNASGNGAATFSRIRRTRHRKMISAARSYDLSVGEYLFDLMSREEEGAEILRQYLEGGQHGE